MNRVLISRFAFAMSIGIVGFFVGAVLMSQSHSRAHADDDPSSGPISVVSVRDVHYRGSADSDISCTHSIPVVGSVPEGIDPPGVHRPGSAVACLADPALDVPEGRGVLILPPERDLDLVRADPIFEGVLVDRAVAS